MNPSPSPQDSVALRIAVMEDSMKAFAYAWVGLIPFLGLPAAIAALFLGIRAGSRPYQGHNPASGYRTAALTLSAFGIGIPLLGALVVVTAAVSRQ